ncbi:MAG: TIGR04053 family radical SAM/SPASM domain-containing protein, partial [Planctomycetaceae bacterium]|nr:TIGR04053 family radical SAM/SPASM domain-containing protein [Planctomycetaceae bacterium]
RASDFGRFPLMFYYEVTQACDLVCKHCRASARETAAADELTTAQSLALIDEIAKFQRKPTLVLTGGDPLKRADLFRLIEHAAGLGIPTALTPSATPLATRDAFALAKQAGVQALGISLDGPNATVHDAFRGFEGSFVKTMEMLDFAHQLGLPVQVNTSVTRRNFNLLDDIAELLGSRPNRTETRPATRTGGIMMWSVFFLVPVGRGLEEERILPEEYEIAFGKLWHHAKSKPFAVKTTEAPHYRRYVLQHGGHPLEDGRLQTADGSLPNSAVCRLPSAVSSASFQGRSHRAPLGVTDGRGIMFVAQNGEIFPAGFLPKVCGKFPGDSPVEVYGNHPVFRALQNPDNYRGICGVCEYRHVCGGSRARAFAVTGDYLGPEPDCCYQVGQGPLVTIESTIPRQSQADR